jgi:hypothetical protein
MGSRRAGVYGSTYTIREHRRCGARGRKIRCSGGRRARDNTASNGHATRDVVTTLGVLPCRLVRYSKGSHNLELYPDIELDRIALSNEIARKQENERTSRQETSVLRRAHGCG